MSFEENAQRILSYDRLKERLDNLIKKRDLLAASCRSEKAAFLDGISSTLGHPNTMQRVQFVLSKNLQYRMNPANRKVYLGAKLFTQTFTPLDHQSVAKKCWQIISQFSPQQAYDPAAVQAFFTAYNTLVLMIEVKEQLIQALIADGQKELEQEIVFLKQQVAAMETECREAVAALNQGKAESSDGAIVVGKKIVTLSASETEILNKYGVRSENSCDTEILLDRNCASLFWDCGKSEDVQAVREFVKGVFYKNVLHFRPGEWKVAYVEQRNDAQGSPVGGFVRELTEEEKDENNGGNFDACIYRTVNGDNFPIECAQSKSDFESLISALYTEQGERNAVFSRQGCDDIAAYNKNNPLAKLPYLTLVIHGFPRDMLEVKYNSNRSLLDKLESLILYGAKYGVSVLYIGTNDPVPVDGGMNAGTWRFDFDRFPMAHYYAEDAEWVRVSDAEESEIKREMLAAANSHNSLPLEKLFEITDFKKPTVGVEIAIPFGLSAGEPYYFASSTNQASSHFNGGPHSFIYGASGKGKTSLVRTLILSGAYYYSPDELQFYLLDFKSEQNNVDYAEFFQDGTDNCYVPHVKFISEKGDKSFADEVLAMMEHIVVDRSDMGCNDYCKYCEAQRKDPTMKPLPAIVFLIDEYNAIFCQGNVRLVNKLISGSNRYRQAGIHIVLIGQERTIELGNFPNRYAFGAEDYSHFSECFSLPSKKLMPVFNQIGGRPGIVAAYRKIKASGQDEINIVKNAFSKDPKAIARMIREKYVSFVVTQQRGGSMKEETADTILTYRKENPRAMTVHDEQEENDTYSLHIGLSSLESSPVCIRFGDRLTGESEYGSYYKNYFVRASVETQIAVLENAMFAYAEFLKGNDPVSRPISFNYFGDWNLTSKKAITLARSTCDLIRKNGLDKVIKLNETKLDVLNEIEKAYSLYESREDSRPEKLTPYLLTFFNCNWISEFASVGISKSVAASPLDADYGEEVNARIAECRKRGLSDSQIEMVLKSMKVSPVGAASAPPDKKDVLRHFACLMTDGHKRKIYIVLGTNNYVDYRTNGFVEPKDSWAEQVVGDETVKSVCRLHGISTRLFDYHDADRWWDNLKKGE